MAYNQMTPHFKANTPLKKVDIDNVEGDFSHDIQAKVKPLVLSSGEHSRVSAFNIDQVPLDPPSPVIQTRRVYNF